MAALEFLFEEFIQKIDAMSNMAKSFIAPDSPAVFEQLKSTLRGIQDWKTEKKCRWEIPRDRPLRTIFSEGKYKKNGGGGHKVYAEVTSVWEIQPRKPPKSPKKPWVRFSLAGIASTRIRIFRVSGTGQPQELAMWRMEIGDENAPGCFFHVQIQGESDKLPFPNWLSVPRLPAFLVTPTVALEFVLGELFQDEWGQEGFPKENYHLQRWRMIQSNRLAKFLEWQRKEVLKDGALGSPWVRLKRLKPNATLFLQGP